MCTYKCKKTIIVGFLSFLLSWSYDFVGFGLKNEVFFLAFGAKA
jgi:hypothetical protein